MSIGAGLPGWSTPPSENFEDLLLAAEEGDPAAWRLLYAQTLPLVQHIVGRLVRPQEVEDVVQLVYERLYERLKQDRNPLRPLEPGGRSPLPEIKNFSAYLAVMARNAAFDYLRRSRRSQNTEIPFDSSEEGRAFEEILSEPETGPSYEVLEELKGVLETLPLGERQALIMHYLEGYSYTEIARIKGISPNTVRTLLQRGRRKVKRRLEELREE